MYNSFINFDKHCTFSLICAMETNNYQNSVKMNFPSLKYLVANRVISRTMTKKIAGRGSNFYLELAQKKNPDGIRVFLNEVHDGSFRVKRSKKIIESNNLSNTHQ